jgi:hypothetical protein
MAKIASAPKTGHSSPVAAAPGYGRIAALAAGDALSFLVFAAVGRHSHSEASGLAALPEIIGTAAPFALGWFLVSPWVGAFRRTKTDTLPKMLARTELAWLASWPVALLLRWATASDHRIPLSFAFIVLVANAGFLAIWRGAFALLAARHK